MVLVLALLALAPAFATGQIPLPKPMPPGIAQAYLYVEPYQVRVEVLFDAAGVLRRRDAAAPLPTVLTAAAQKDLADAISRQSAEWAQVRAEGRPVTGAFLGAAIIKGKPGNTLPFEEGTDIPLEEAMVGLTWEFPTAATFSNLTLGWHGFAADPGLADLPITVFFGSQSERMNLTRAQPEATWQSRGRIAKLPPLAEMPRAPQGVQLAPVWLHAAWAVLFLGLVYLIVIRLRRLPWPGYTGAGLALWVTLSIALVVVHSLVKPAPAVKTTDQAKTILSPLLRNVYRAFDHRDESEIYDVLARSVSGGLLRTLYLETIQALTLDGREGTRVTIQNFDVEVSAVRPVEAGFSADCEWTALGSVGHWGHTHTRVNRYRATVTVMPEPDSHGSASRAWKLAGLEVTEARRI